MTKRYRPQEGYGTNYEDTGCAFAPSCLNCPFPECLEVEKDNARLKSGERLFYPSPKKIARNRGIHKAKGESTRDIAEAFKISKRTVQRVLKSKMPPPPDKTLIPVGRESPAEIADELSVYAGVK